MKGLNCVMKDEGSVMSLINETLQEKDDWSVTLFSTGKEAEAMFYSFYLVAHIMVRFSPTYLTRLTGVSHCSS